MASGTDRHKADGNTGSRPRHRRWCLTLNNYDESDLAQIIEDFNNKKAHYVIGKEVGEKGTPHLQGYVEFPNARGLSGMKKINDKAHWEVAKSTKEKNYKYCTKDGDFISNFPLSRIERCLKKYDDVVWKVWQETIINLVENEPDDRTINWYYDEKGNIGKSFLTKYLVLKYKAIVCDGKKADIMNQVKTWMDNNPENDPKVVVMDVPRTKLDYINYEVIESLKNGCIYSGKYEGGVCVFDSPHIICFANEPPHLESMSKDRWNIECLDKVNRR